MRFRESKLGLDMLPELRKFYARAIMPFALMPAPVYVLLRKNAKLVAVKAPLDFFTADELVRLASFDVFYMHPSVDATLPFVRVGKQVKVILDGTTSTPDESKGGSYSILPPAPHQVSDAVLRAIGPLWGNNVSIEPFFVALFVQAVCGALPAEVLVKARERSVKVCETAVLQSSWSVFLALHLGNCELGFLDRLRRDSFLTVLDGQSSLEAGSAAKELLTEAMDSLGDGQSAVGVSAFAHRARRTAQKIACRLQRVREELVKPGIRAASIYGKGGFADA